MVHEIEAMQKLATICLGLLIGLTCALSVSLLCASSGFSTRDLQVPPPTSTLPVSIYLPEITEYNASHLQFLGVYGHGGNSHAVWGRDGHTLIVGGIRGL